MWYFCSLCLGCHAISHALSDGSTGDTFSGTSGVLAGDVGRAGMAPHYFKTKNYPIGSLYQKHFQWFFNLHLFPLRPSCFNFMIMVFTPADSWDFSEKNKNNKIGGEISKYSWYERIIKYLNFKISNFSRPKLYSTNLGLQCHFRRSFPSFYYVYFYFFVTFKPSAADS